MIAALRGKYIYFLMFVISILAWLTGATFGWSSPVTFKLVKHTSDYPFKEPITKDGISWIASSLVMAGIFGSLLFGKLPDLIGRKNTVLLLSAPHVVAYGILTWGDQVYQYVLARSISGLVIGGFFTIMALYISELTHHRNRGMFITLTMIAMYPGQIFSLILGPYVSIKTLNMTLFILSLLFVPLFYFVAPETPYYYASKGEDELALKLLEKLRGHSGCDVQKELEDIKINTKKNENASFFDLFRSPVARKALFIMLAFTLFEAATGLKSILIYAEIFFEQAGTSIPSNICPIIVVIVQVITTFISSLTCDKFGRRKLLLISCIGTGISLIILGAFFHMKESGENVDKISWLPLVAFIFVLIFYGIGLGPLPNVLIGELFPMNFKCITTMIVVTFLSTETFLFTKYFLPVSAAVGMAPMMWFFGCMCFCTFGVVYFLIVETNNRTMNEIQVALEKRRL